MSVWLYENVNTRIEGHIVGKVDVDIKVDADQAVVGFDEYMNLVLDEATEVHTKRKTEKKLGRIMLKGDNITLIQAKEGAAQSN